MCLVPRARRTIGQINRECKETWEKPEEMLLALSYCSSTTLFIGLPFNALLKPQRLGSNLRFLYIFGGSGPWCAVRAALRGRGRAQRRHLRLNHGSLSRPQPASEALKAH